MAQIFRAVSGPIVLNAVYCPCTDLSRDEIGSTLGLPLARIDPLRASCSSISNSRTGKSASSDLKTIIASNKAYFDRIGIHFETCILDVHVLLIQYLQRSDTSHNVTLAGSRGNGAFLKSSKISIIYAAIPWCSVDFVQASAEESSLVETE